MHFHLATPLLEVHWKEILREGITDKCTWIVFTVMLIINFKVGNILSDNERLK